jgi:hypothetical protein
VLRPGGRFLLDDNMPPEDAELDAFMNRFEQWRDPSHVRAYPVSQWRSWIEGAGLMVEHIDPLVYKSIGSFDQWTGRMRMPEAERAALEAWLIAAPARCAEFFGVVVADGRVRSIGNTFAIIVARKRK